MGTPATLWMVAVMSLPLGAGQSLLLQWKPSDDSSVTGYKVYFRDLSSTNVTALDAGQTTLFTLTNLCEAVTYDLYVTAYNGVGLESDPSNIVDFTVPLGRLTTKLTRDPLDRPVMTFDLEALLSRRVALQSSTNLTDWITLTTSDPGQPLVCQVTNTSAEVKMFYRSFCLP